MIDKIGICVLLQEIHKYPEEHLELDKEQTDYLAYLVEQDIFEERRKTVLRELRDWR